MQYTEKELQKLIENVEKEFTAHLAKAEEGVKATLAKSESVESAAPSVDGTEPLAKAEDDKPAKAEDEKKDKEEAPKSDEKPAAEAKEGDKPAEAPAKEEGKEAAPADAPAKEESKEAAPAPDHCDYDDEDMDHMHKMYASMSKGELRAHHDAIKKTLDGMGMEKCGDMAPAPMAKSEETQAVEVKPEVIQPSPEVEVLKTEVQAKSAKIEELQKSLELVTEFVAKLAKKSAPQGKAITHLETIAKSESLKEDKQLSKTEITTILAKKAADPSLTKSDRDAINAYYFTGQVNVNSISHLLKSSGIN
jgi:hypothetical protein